jgi:hypothetical protein
MRKNQTESRATFRGKTIVCIEKLLQNPIDDYRKNAVYEIFLARLVNYVEKRI